MKKQEIINELLKDDLNNLNDMGNDIHGWIEDILLSGFKGYNNMTIKQLKFEYKARYEFDVC